MPDKKLKEKKEDQLHRMGCGVSKCQVCCVCKFFIPPFASFSSLLKDTRNWDTGKGERNSHSSPGLVCIPVWDSINV